MSIMKRYKIKHDIFSDLNNEFSAYSYGLFLADGSTTKRTDKNKTVSWSLHINDIQVLEQIRDQICKEKPIYIRNNVSIYSFHLFRCMMILIVYL